MTNIFDEFSQRILIALRALGFNNEDVEGKFTIEPPRDPSYGDLATNAAMTLAKSAKKPPRKLAEEIIAHLEDDADIQTLSIAGPGFINIHLKSEFWQAYLESVLKKGQSFGRSEIGAGCKINVEYVSANPTGPMHVAHCRGAVIGDVIANLLSFAGFNVTREYYINDAGSQVDVLARSAFLRYKEALGHPIGDIPEGLYPGAYLKTVGEYLKQHHGEALLKEPESVWLETVKKAAIDLMMQSIKSDLEVMGVHHDVFFSEKSLKDAESDKISTAIETLKKQGHAYYGVLPRPKGNEDAEWEEREQLLFRSTDFGDDADRVLVKADGSYTYFVADIAYHFDKALRGFHNMIDVLGADHSGHIKRMKSAVRAITDGKGELEVVICQLVRLYKGGELFKMSKRAGTFVTLRDLVEEVGADAVRFTMLMRKNDAPLDFDIDKAIDMSRENPVFYVQYAHARGCSVFRQAAEAFSGMSVDSRCFEQADLSLLEDPGELQLIKLTAGFPRLVEAAAQMREPHRIAFYLFHLASEFHAHWNKGKDKPHLRFINPNKEQLSFARLALVKAVLLVIANGLSLLGVSAPEEMT